MSSAQSPSFLPEKLIGRVRWQHIKAVAVRLGGRTPQGQMLARLLNNCEYSAKTAERGAFFHVTSFFIVASSETMSRLPAWSKYCSNFSWIWATAKSRGEAVRRLALLAHATKAIKRAATVSTRPGTRAARLGTRPNGRAKMATAFENAALESLPVSLSMV